MDGVLGLVARLAAHDLALLVIAGVIGALFIVSTAFCGYAILLRAGHQRRDRLWEGLRARWEAPVLAAIVDPEQVPVVHALVTPEHEMHFVHFVLEYSRRMRGEEQLTLQKLVEPYLDLIAERLGDRRAEVRTRAIQTLGTLGLPKYANELLAGLDDASPLVSMVAARYLARREFPEFAPAVIERLHRFEGWNRNFLASMLATMGPACSAALRSGLSDEQAPPWLRSVHAEALRMQIDPAAADVAITVLSTAKDIELIAALFRLLATVGRPEHVPVIREWCDSPDPIIRARALHALGALSSEEDIPLLVDAMYDESPWAALHATRGVREAGGKALLAEIARSEHPNAVLAAQILFAEAEA